MREPESGLGRGDGAVALVGRYQTRMRRVWSSSSVGVWIPVNSVEGSITGG